MEKAVVDNDVGVETDRLSELPIEVLQHILSFLPTKQVFQSTLLSTIWRHVWTTFPTLKFDSTNKRNSEDVKRIKANFYKFVEKTLRIRHHQSERSQIKNFELVEVLPHSKSMSRVDRWNSFVLESDVEELNLKFRYSLIDYILPQAVLCAKSLTALTLHTCKLESTCCGDINLPSLKKLSLTFVYADDQVFRNLVSGCPVIEDMKFGNCRGIKSMKFFGLPKVMAITVTQNHGLERLELALEASNLYYLYIDQGSNPELNLHLLPCKNLKELIIDTPNVTEKWLDEHLSGLPLLENLRLKVCSGLERIKLSSHHHLKSLELWLCKNLVEVMIDTPKLCRFLYFGETAISFSLNASGLLKAEYWLWPPYGTWDAKKIEFLSKMRNSKVFKLNIIDFKLSYEKPIYKGENPSCCKFLPFPCWRHCLKTVKIDSLKGYTDEELLYKYFSENAKTLEDFQFHVGGIA
uniref:F-box domain-containing protein n=1 Tax=Quercus lobata TaxID=97700 RepID=A0A7N2LR32_QUELO